MRKFAAILLLVLSSAFGAQPTARFYAWGRTNIGYPSTSGVPSWSVGSTVTADTTGVTNASPAIQVALTAAMGSDTAVLLPDGIYLINTRLDIPFGVVLRGASTNAVLKPNNGDNPLIGVGWANDGFPQPDAAPPTITSGATSGSTSIVISDASGWPTSSRLIDIRAFPPITNEAMTVFGPALTTATTTAFGNQQNRRAGLCQTVRLISRSGTTLTFAPPLVDNFTNSPIAMYYSGAVAESGVENLTINYKPGGVQITSGLEAIAFHQAFNVWASNVIVISQPRKGITFDRCANVEVRHCVFWDHPANGANGECLDFQQGVSGWLAEDNIFYHQFPSICAGDADSGVQAGAILYNYFGPSSVVNNVMNPDILFHGYNPEGVLVEGNIGGKIQADGYYGGSRNNTVYRNWWSGDHPDVSVNILKQAISLDRFSENFSVGANILGTNGMDLYEMTGETGGQWSVWRNGYPNPGNNGYAAYYDAAHTPNWFWPGPTRFGPSTGALTSGTNLLGNFAGVRSGTSIALQDPSNTNLYTYTATYAAGTSTNLLLLAAVTLNSGVYCYVLNADSIIGTNGWQRNFGQVTTSLIRAGNYDYKRGLVDSNAAWTTFPQSEFSDYVSAPPPFWYGHFPVTDPSGPVKVFPNMAYLRYIGANTNTPAASAPVTITGRVEFSGTITIYPK